MHRECITRLKWSGRKDETQRIQLPSPCLFNAYNASQSQQTDGKEPSKRAVGSPTLHHQIPGNMYQVDTLEQRQLHCSAAR